jgi:hypothetical protein
MSIALSEGERMSADGPASIGPIRVIFAVIAAITASWNSWSRELFLARIGRDETNASKYQCCLRTAALNMGALTSDSAGLKKMSMWHLSEWQHSPGHAITRLVAEVHLSQKEC